MRKPFQGLIALAFLLSTAVAFSQSQSGNIYGKTTDEQGGALPGVSVTLTGVGAPQTTVSGAAGEYRFINAAPGTYAIKHSLPGFGDVTRDKVTVNVGKNTEVTVAMKIAGVATGITIAGEVPLLDTRRTSQGATVAKVELESIPSARDPWVVMQTVPGIQMDRVNVAGSESGQQSNAVNKGAVTTQGVWNVDGVNITDMGSRSSATYYDFDSFEEINVSTGGSDPSIQTPGIQMNMVTKRGSNDIHGGARVLITDQHFETTNKSDELTAQLGPAAAGNTIQVIQDYGADVGGPIVKDRVWLWGSYGRNQIDLTTAGGATDKTTLENLNAKLNAQIVDSNAATVFFSRADKLKFGRNTGPTRPPETGWNQSGPTQIYKFEDSQIFSSSLFATALASYLDPSGFGLISAGRGQTYVDENSVWHNSYYDYITERKQTQYSGNLSGFFRTGDIGHEVKVGFSYRKTPVTSLSAWPQGMYGCAAGFCADVPVVVVTKDAVSQQSQFYYSGYLSDTLTLKNLTINVGVRYDNQKSTPDAKVIPGSRAPANIVPNNILATGTNVPQAQGLNYKDFQPRLGLTYSIDQKTLVRASYARFSDQLGPATANSVGSSFQGAYYKWNDKNGNKLVEAGEVDTSELIGYYGFNPDNPNAVGSSPTVYSPDLKNVKTDEILIGAEREILPALAVSFTGTYRRLSDFSYTHAFGLTSADYRQSTKRDTSCPTGMTGFVCGNLPNGTAYQVPFYEIIPGRTPTGATRFIIENQPDYYQTYLGAELQVTKRFTDRWMARASFSYNDWKQHLSSGSFVDPTNRFPNTNEDGGQVVQQSAGSGSKGGVFINGKWTFNMNALYALPLGFNVAGNFFARQGYPVAYYERTPTISAFEGTKNVSIAAMGEYRLPAVTDLDLRLEKVLKVSSLDVTIGLDVFNVFNSGTALQRQYRAGIATTNYILEQQSPRIARFGARLAF